MSASLLSRRKLLTMKIETTAGTDIVPSAATDAIATENLQIKPPSNNATTNEHTSALDSAADIPIGSPVQITFDQYLKGSGTPGSAPECGVPLQCVGFYENLTAVAIGAPTAATAGTATTLTLPAATFSGADGAYKGFPIILSGNPTVAYDTQIVDWTKVASTPVATLADTFSPALSGTTQATIPAHAAYWLQSSGIKSASMYVYQDGTVYKCVGCKGDVSFKLDANGMGMWSFTFTGRLSAKADVAMPTPTFPGDAVAKIVWNNRNGVSGLFLDRTPIAVTQLTFGTNNGVINPPNPNQAEGFDETEIIKRELRGVITPKSTLVATRDSLTQYKDAGISLIAARAGRALGNRVAFLFYSAQLSGYSHEDQGGILGDNLPFKANGIDRKVMAVVFY